MVTRVPLLAVLGMLILAVTGCGAPSQRDHAAPPSVPAAPDRLPTATTPATPAAPSTRPAQFTDQQLVDTCVATVTETRTDGLIHVHEARVLEREIEPRWLVHIPATGENGEYHLRCILGGTPDAPEWVVAASAFGLITDEQLHSDLTSNDEYLDSTPG